MKTVFKLPDDPDKDRAVSKFLKSLDCPIEIRIGEPCDAIPYEQWTEEQKDRLARLYFGKDVNFFVTLSKEELEQIEQGDKRVVLRNVKMEVEMP